MNRMLNHHTTSTLIMRCMVNMTSHNRVFVVDYTDSK